MQDSGLTPSWLMLGYIVGGNDVLLNPGSFFWCCLVLASNPNILLAPYKILQLLLFGLLSEAPRLQLFSA